MMDDKTAIDLMDNQIGSTKDNPNIGFKEVKCEHELNISDENEHLNVIDAISVQTELEQLFNDFNLYNHSLQVFKKLLNLKELKNQHNFFTFNQPRKSDPPAINNENICCTKSHNLLQNSPYNELSTKLLFKGGELSAMQVHSQLSKIKEQFIESQMLVTCFIHNMHCLRKHYCGTALDLVSSHELLANLEKNHSTLKRCKSIFKYQCTKKREQLNKLKNQLRQAHEDWNQLIVKEPKIIKLTNEELLLINKTQMRKKRKSLESKLINTTDDPSAQTTDTSGQSHANSNESTRQSLIKDSSIKENNTDNSGNSSRIITDDLNRQSIVEKENEDKNQEAISTGSSGVGSCDSAVHSESESTDSLQELAAAIYRRKSKLDRMEKECYTFMSRLANRNRTVKDNIDDETNHGQFDGSNSNSNLIIDEDEFDDDNFNDYANEYDDDLLDEEYDDELGEFDEIMNDDPFAATEQLDIESLINSRFSNLPTTIEPTEEELITNQELEDDMNNLMLNTDTLDPIDNSVIQDAQTNDLDYDLQFANGEQMIDDHSYSVDYLIGQSRLITNNNVSTNESAANRPTSFNDSLLEDSIMIDNASNRINLDLERTANRSRLALSDESLNLLVDDESSDLTNLMPRTSNDETTLAKTGEPVSLMRLRRSAVKILASRIRTEKEYYEGKESELRQKLDELQSRNDELKNQLNRPNKQFFLISTTAIIFCSLINYFIQTTFN